MVMGTKFLDSQTTIQGNPEDFRGLICRRKSSVHVLRYKISVLF